MTGPEDGDSRGKTGEDHAGEPIGRVARVPRRGADPPRARGALRPDELWIALEIGEIGTTWVVYGTRERFQGELIGIPSPELFRSAQPVLS